MRRSIVQLIFQREWRDLLRDRRTLWLILGLPVLLYPIFTLVSIAFAYTALEQKTIVGIVGWEHLPQPKSHPEGIITGGLWIGECSRKWDDPALLIDGAFATDYLQSELDISKPVVQLLDSPNEESLQSRQIDALVVIPEDFLKQFHADQTSIIRVMNREGDEISKAATRRVTNILGLWQRHLKQVRFARNGLPANFDAPIEIEDPQRSKPLKTRTADELRDVMVKFLPFLLVMWTLAGALHPAIDLSAGEKERGTMETLLISPAERSEIVTGKFLAIMLFSYLSAIWNVIWMAIGTILLGWLLDYPIISLTGLAGCSLLALPLAAVFSGIGLALGVFARSTKEGQYYLMPLFLLVLPLVMWSLAPGMKLSLGLCFVPFTGLALLQQQIMSVAGEPITWVQWLATLGTLAVCVLLSLCFASYQFRQEAVLFRDSEPLSLKSWWKNLLRRQ